MKFTRRSINGTEGPLVRSDNDCDKSSFPLIVDLFRTILRSIYVNYNIYRQILVPCDRMFRSLSFHFVVVGEMGDTNEDCTALNKEDVLK